MSSPARKANPKLTESPLFSSVSKARLKSLYSDLSRQKTSNPAAYSSNVDWWKRTLATLVEQGLQSGPADALVLHAGPDLVETLRYESVGKPIGLAAVIADLRDKHALIPLEEFLSSPTSVYDRESLAYRVVSFAVGKPLWWAMEQLNLVDSEHVESEASLWKKVAGNYVFLSNVEKAADAVTELLRQNVTSSPADSLYSFESFRRLSSSADIALENSTLSETDVKVLLRFLDRDRKIIVTDGKAIKVVDSIDSKTPRIISSIDKGILELKTAVENMELQIEALNKRITEKIQKIKECLGANRKEVAMTHLKSRKQYEDLLRKRLGSLEVLQATLIQVEAAAQDVEIMKQYESSTATLRAILSHPSLQRERIDATMDAMAEASAEQREVDEAIRTGMSGITEDVDEDELQAELARLVADAQSEQKEREELRALEDTSALPSVPSGTPMGSGDNTKDERSHQDTSIESDATKPVIEQVAT
ncbi:Snf7-domain-containing protein [Fomitiporia mediterranea MF3/22]|uniref:Snf7-domain-containing protein n=1 Tax=Fomitiporia mediterranea (strain MF3/22) TaxID=694068 RepID=UPI00044082B8|nr:Snf7-domain-containing protein [Fomitiporia mediterranea MF3/22]EJD02423.1 Snf7-domain-containing protein [Fomitiporia mediterranea MF3/22]